MAALKRVSEQLGHHPLRPVDAALCEAPFHLRQLDLRCLGRLELSGVVKVVDLDACLQSLLGLYLSLITEQDTNLGEQVRNASNHTRPSDGKARSKPVTLPSNGTELLRLELGADTGHFRDPTAGELHADDVGVLAERAQHFRVYVETGRDTGEVVDHDREGTRIGKLYMHTLARLPGTQIWVCVPAYLLEERHDGILVHREVEVARRQDEHKVSPGLGRQTRLRDDIPRALAAAAERDGEIWTAGFDGDFACEGDEAGFFFGGEGDGFPVGACEDDCWGEKVSDASEVRSAGVNIRGTYCRGGRT